MHTKIIGSKDLFKNFLNNFVLTPEGPSQTTRGEDGSQLDNGNSYSNSSKGFRHTPEHIFELGQARFLEQSGILCLAGFVDWGIFATRVRVVITCVQLIIPVFESFNSTTLKFLLNVIHWTVVHTFFPILHCLFKTCYSDRFNVSSESKNKDGGNKLSGKNDKNDPGVLSEKQQNRNDRTMKISVPHSQFEEDMVILLQLHSNRKRK